MQRNHGTPDAYCADVPAPQGLILARIRELLLAALPGQPEGLRHGMLDYPGVANLAAQKHYVSLYVPPAVLAAHGDHFPGVQRGKSCLRFRRVDQVHQPALEALLRAAAAHHKQTR